MNLLCCIFLFAMWIWLYCQLGLTLSKVIIFSAVYFIRFLVTFSCSFRTQNALCSKIQFSFDLIGTPKSVLLVILALGKGLELDFNVRLIFARLDLVILDFFESNFGRGGPKKRNFPHIHTFE